MLYVATFTVVMSVAYVINQEHVMTKLEKAIRRELVIKDITYTVVIDPTGLKLTEKGRRKGIELKWADIVSGDAGIAAALQASGQ
jgi:hypothetical protein